MNAIPLSSSLYTIARVDLDNRQSSGDLLSIKLVIGSVVMSQQFHNRFLNTTNTSWYNASVQHFSYNAVCGTHKYIT